MATIFLYQRTLSLPTVFATPDNADSTAYGTNIFPSKPEGIVTCSFGRITYCQRPFKFVQLFVRIICGRGYSGKGFEEFTFSDQGVKIFAEAIFQSWVL